MTVPDNPLYDALLSDRLAAGRLALAQARAADARLAAAGQLHQVGIAGLCAGCGLVAPCPTRRLADGALTLPEARELAGRQLSALAAARVRLTPEQVDEELGRHLEDDELGDGVDRPLSASERAREPRHFLAGFAMPARDRADGVTRAAPAVPAVGDLLAGSPGVGRFLDSLLGPDPA